MRHIAIYVPPNSFASAIYGFMDIFKAVNLLNKSAGGQSIFHCQTVAIGDTTSVQSFSNHSITPDYSLDAMPRPDIWIIPGFFEAMIGVKELKKTLQHLQPLVERLKQDSSNGSIICGNCIGNFVIAEAGLLDDKPVQVYWRTEQLFQQLYPKIERRADVTVMDSDTIITAAGASAYGYLALHLARRFGGEQLAIETAKYMLLDINRLTQPSYRSLYPWLEHNDERVRQSQLTMLDRYADNHNMQDLADECQLSQRQYLRRFKRAVGLTPLTQLQQIRLMEACKKLECSDLPTQNIIWKVGYNDASSFRKLFKKELGTTMEQYRQRYKVA